MNPLYYIWDIVHTNIHVEGGDYVKCKING